MAEALGIASSITALIQNTVSLVHFIEDFKNSTKERDDLLRELRLLEICLVGLRRVALVPGIDVHWLAMMQVLNDENAFKKFAKLLDDLKKKLQEGSSAWKRLMRRARWSFTKGIVETELKRIERFKTVILIAGQQDCM